MSEPPTSASPPDRPRLPSWARLADAVGVALLVLGVLVAVFGGVRARPWGVRVRIISETRVWVLAAAVIAARHALVRIRPLHHRLAESTRLLGRSPAGRAAWPVFLATRPTILLVGYLAIITFGYPVAPAFRVSLREFWNLPARWDAGWYLGIALDGYSYSRHVRGQQNIAFFPAFPKLMRAGGYLLGSESHSDPTDLPVQPRRTLWAGVLISMGAFYWALVYLFHLAREDIGDERAPIALLLIATYPLAVFFSAPYSESLFLLGVVATLFHFRRDELSRASAWGLMVGLTRPNGCLLSIPLTILALQRMWPALEWPRRPDMAIPGTKPGGRMPDERVSALARRVVVAAAPGIGMLVYSGFVYTWTGNPFTWAQAQTAWGREYRALGQMFSDTYAYVIPRGPFVNGVWVPFDVWNGLPTLFVAATIVPVLRRFGWAYALFLLLNLVPPFVSGGLLSMGRLTAIMFPSFFYLAAVLSVRTVPAWAASFAIFQALAATLFFTWRELF
ncbi:MAG: hypothetical protein HYX76_15890 [Acidobacteria bacterium]|nr:hypothetical protein [Acidobacteriota bacterium]